MPDLRIDAEDFNDPWHAHGNAKGKGRASGHGDSTLDAGGYSNQAEDVEQDDWQYDENAYTGGFGAGDDYRDSYAPIPAQQPNSGLHSRPPSVGTLAHNQAPQQPLPQSSALEGATLDLFNVHPLGQPASLQPPPPSHQGSVQPSLPPNRQGSVQPHPPPNRQHSVQPHLLPSHQGSFQPQLLHSHQGMVQSSTQSRQGSVNPLGPQDEGSVYEQGHINAQASKKRPHASIGGSKGPKAKRKARKAPQTPIRARQEIAGPSTGTRSQVNPMIVSTDATPVAGASGSRHVTALYVDDLENEDGSSR